MRNKIYKLIFIVTILLLNNEITFGQGPNWLWGKSAGGSNNDYGQATVVDINGNTYVTGYFLSDTLKVDNINLVNNNPGSSTSDIFIIKYDSTGNIAWARSVGGTGVESGNGITTDISGNIYLTGNFTSNSITLDGIPLINAGGNDLFIAKYNSSGNAIWAKSVGGTSDDYSNAITVDGNGYSYITGYFNSTVIDFGSNILNAIGNDIFIAKFDAGGNATWAKKAGGNYEEYSYGISIDGSGNSYITGYFGSDTINFDNFALYNTGNSTIKNEIFIAKYDGFGNVLWAKSASGNSWDYSNSIAADLNGNAYITGQSYSNTLTFDSIVLVNANGNTDFFITKYDSSGQVLWAHSTSGDLNDEGRSVTLDSVGNAYVTGAFHSSTINFGSVTLTNSSSERDLFVVKYDTSGNVLWAKKAGGSNDDYGLGISVGATGNPFVTGYSNCPIITLDSSALTNVGSLKDVFILELSCITYSTINVGSCNSYISPSGNNTWVTSGTYMDTIFNSNPCYDVITINLIIGTSSTTSSTAINSCYSYTSPSGNYTWTVSGTYMDTIPNSVACDSIMTINLTILAADTSVTQNGSQLTANAIGATYQWLDCSGMLPVISDTNQIFTPIVNGNYAVRITQYGCINTSACYTITGSATGHNIYDGGHDTICGGYFFDTGGLAGNYQDSENITYTLCSPAGNNLTVAFNTFKLENIIFDFLKIYDGTDTLSPLIGIFGGINSPGIVNASNGCLTFHFTSDVTINNPGWEASINCTPVCSAHFSVYPDTLTPHNWFAINQATGAAPLTYLWNWGDTTTSTGAYPSHTYSTPGFYNICLTIIDSAGYTCSYCDSSNYLYRSDQSNAIITINVVSQIPTGNQEIVSERRINIFPNPSNGGINIFSSSVIEKIEISDLLGQVIYHSKPNDKNLSLQIANTGIYFISITVDNKIVTKKIIVQH